MHKYYAQLDESGVCSGVSQLAGDIDDINAVELASFDTSVLGKRYDALEEIFVEII